jgi:hypothetical protein
MSEALYKLSKPVTLTYDSAEGKREEVIDTIAFREPDGNTLLLLDTYGETPMRLMMEIIADLWGKTFAEVKKLPAKDIGPLGDRAFALLPVGPKTGAAA